MIEGRRKILAVVGPELAGPFRQTMEGGKYEVEVLVRHPELGRKNEYAVRKLVRRHSADTVIMEVKTNYDEMMLRKVGSVGNIAIVNADEEALIRRCIGDGITTVTAPDKEQQVRGAMEAAETYLDVLTRQRAADR